MIIRTYGCNDCGTTFEVRCRSNDGDPDCPNCARVLEWRPQRLNINGDKSRALDITQRIMEEQYGFTNFKDKTDPGETVVLPPAPVQAATKDRIVQEVASYAQQAQGVNLTPAQAEMAAGFWNNKSAQQFPQMSAADVLGAAKGAAKIADAEGVNPMKMLHDLGRKGKLQNKIDVVARAKM